MGQQDGVHTSAIDLVHLPEVEDDPRGTEHQCLLQGQDQRGLLGLDQLARNLDAVVLERAARADHGPAGGLPGPDLRRLKRTGHGPPTKGRSSR